MQQSPRWAFMKFFTISKDDSLYLKRLRVIQTPWMSLYVHWIYRPDMDRFGHDHPWTFRSFVLRGWYDEIVYEKNDGQRTSGGPWKIQHWKRFSWHRMGLDQAHKITAIPQDWGRCPLITLVFVGKRRRNWGFWGPSSFIPWQEYDEAGLGPDPFDH